MKILIVANYNKGMFSPFVLEQVEALKKLGVKFELFGIVGKGAIGYLRNLSMLKRRIAKFKPDLIHAHYGLSGLLANLQRVIPVVTTFHGSDVHSGGFILRLSKIVGWMSKYNIFVTSRLKEIANFTGVNSEVIPCGVDEDRFIPIDKDFARKQLGWSLEKKYVLFSGSFSNAVKNPELAQKAIEKVPKTILIEMQGLSREEVVYVMNASDCLLMTSHREGSPMVIKEAMACGIPIVSVNVGDVKEIIGNTKGCYIAKYDAEDIASKIKWSLKFQNRTNGRVRIFELKLSSDLVAQKILNIYKQNI